MPISQPNRSVHGSGRARQRGISLIELLVSLLIFSFGMLGLAGLQTRTLAFNQGSLYRSQATALTDDILERMRVDRVNATAGNWNSAITEKSTDITGANIYDTDLKSWKASLEEMLPDGRASITVTTAGADIGVVVVVIEWSDLRGNDAQQWRTTSRL
jgi:type IV pilus assembly protein PilV